MERLHHFVQRRLHGTSLGQCSGVHGLARKMDSELHSSVELASEEPGHVRADVYSTSAAALPVAGAEVSAEPETAVGTVMAVVDQQLRLLGSAEQHLSSVHLHSRAEHQA